MRQDAHECLLGQLRLALLGDVPDEHDCRARRFALAGGDRPVGRRLQPAERLLGANLHRL